MSRLFRSSRSSTPVPDSSASSASSQLSKQLEETSLADGTDQLDGDLTEDLQDTESDSGRFRQLASILRKTISVKDLTSVRISLPATMMEPVGNLEHWTYIDRPDYFAAIGEGEDELDRFLGVIRWLFTKELKFAKHPIAKPFNSILGEHFHCYYDTPVLSLHPKNKQPNPTVHLDDTPSPEVLASAGRPGGSSNITAAAALKSSPSITSITSLSKKKPSPASTSDPVLSSASSFASARSVTASTSGASSIKSAAGAPSGPEKTARVVIVNEQTSHHPPISAFLVEARTDDGNGKKRIVRMRGVDQLSAKFTGVNVKVLPGEHNHGLFIELPERDEEYRITHPTAAVAGIMRAAPYATICDTTTVSVAPIDPEARKAAIASGKKTLRAVIEYREESWITKPRFYVEGVVYWSSPNEAGGGEGDERFSKIKQVPADKIVGKLEGNWRGEVKWKKNGGSSITLVDLTPLAVVPKSVAPIPSQDALETRKVWEPVCLALYKKDYSTASKEKQRIEQEQRDKAEERKKKGEGYAPKYFEREPEDVREWDGRPVLTEEGRRVIERDFEASYEI